MNIGLNFAETLIKIIIFKKKLYQNQQKKNRIIDEMNDMQIIGLSLKLCVKSMLLLLLLFIVLYML